MRFFNIKQKGFTLVEIMVVLSIIAILGGILISSSYKSNQIRNSLMLDTEAVALYLRDMQNRTTGFSVDEQRENIGYGVFFDLSAPSKINTFFKTTTGIFNEGDLSLVSAQRPDQDLILSSGNHIKRICINGSCNATTSKLAIYFLKPRPYAKFAILTTYGGYTNLDSYNKALTNVCIEIAPSSGTDLRRVEVYAVGQITFAYGACK